MLNKPRILNYTEALIKTSVFILLICTTSSVAYSDDMQQRWLSYRTQNFNVLYTKPYKVWAINAAKELELIRSTLKAEQGWVVAQQIDVIVMDPIAEANGLAYPVSDNPVIELYTTKPKSDSIIHNFNSWQRILALHEYAHIVHLGQQSRNKSRRFLANVWDLYSVAKLTKKRWVSEGYATLLESKFSGYGRLHSHYVNAVIRQWAVEGALPSYEKLNGGSGYMDGNMPYIVGAYFFAWLEEQYGDKTLADVWVRWVAVKERDFEEAFFGVYGHKAKVLYKRFVAELTYRAIDKRNKLSHDANESLLMEFNNRISDISISADSKKIALVRRRNSRDYWLEIYELSIDKNLEKKYQKKLKKVLEKDPVDIPNKPPNAFPLKRLEQLNSFRFRGITNVVFERDNKSVLFLARRLDRNGHLFKGLYRWEFQSEKVTELSQVHDIQVFTIGNDEKSDPNYHVFAVHEKYGASKITRINIRTGKQDIIVEETFDNSFDKLDFNARNNTLAFLEHKLNHGWHLKLKNFNKSSLIEIPLPKNYQYLSDPRWSPDGERLAFVASVNSVLAIYEYDFNSGLLKKLKADDKVVGDPFYLKKNKELLYTEKTSLGMNLKKILISEKPDIITELNVNKTINHGSKFPLGQASSIDTVAESFIGEKEKLYSKHTISNSFILGVHANAQSASILEVGVKGSDRLKRSNWYFNYTTGRDNELSGKNIGYTLKQGHFQYGLHWLDYDFDQKGLGLDELTPQDLGLRHKRDGVLFSLDYSIYYKQNKILPRLRLFSGETDGFDESYQTFDLAHARQWQTMNWGIYQRSKFSYTLGRLESEDWGGYDVDFDLFFIKSKMKFGLNFLSKEREFDDDTANNTNDNSNTNSNSNTNNTSLLNLGGYRSNLFQEMYHVNTVFEQSLPFFAKRFNRYKRYEIYYPLNSYIPYSRSRVFYRQYKIPDEENVNIYGLNFYSTVSAPSVGLDGLNFEAGIVGVEQDRRSADYRAWLGMYYRF